MSSSGRASPFRRPESPSQSSSASPATTIRASTPTSASTPNPLFSTSNRPSTPSKLANSSSASGESTFSPRAREFQASPTKRAGNYSSSSSSEESGGRSGMMGADASPKYTPMASRPTVGGTASPMKSQPANMDALSRLPAAQVREMRESFQILDQDSDGMVNREDVGEMLKSLGLDSSPSSLTPYFPASVPHPLPLPVYLSQLSSLLAPISPPSELLAALSAFDDDDSGQIDVQELVEAVSTSRPEDGSRGMNRREVESVMEGFVGRRAFGGFSTSISKSKGEVFRYREWVSGLGAAGGAQAKVAAA